MRRKAFKGTLCQKTPAHAGMLAYDAAKSCIRKGDHDGPHRNRVVEWDQQPWNAEVRRRKDCER